MWGADLFRDNNLEWEDHLAISLYTLSFHFMLFAICRLFILDKKKLSWIVILANSCAMALFGFSYIMYRMLLGVNVFQLQPSNLFAFVGSCNASSAVCTILATSHGLDFALGILYYKKYLSMLDSNCRLLFWIWLWCFLFWGSSVSSPSNSMMWMLPGEASTAILAFGSIVSSAKSPLLYGLAFFFTRILLPAHVLVQIIKLPDDVPVMAVMVFRVALVVNAYSLYKWCEQLGQAKIKSNRGVSTA
jgi:hypothetical protein